MATTNLNLGTGVQAVGATKCSVMALEGVSLVGKAASDVIQLCWFDKPVLVIGGAVKVTTAEGTASVLTVDVGVAAGATVVDGADVQAASAGDVLAGGSTATNATVIAGTTTTPDSLDLTIATATGNIDDAIVDVYAVVCDLSDTIG